MGQILAPTAVGALALSFASKDVLSNVFGGIMVMCDRPFVVGDYVSITSRGRRYSSLYRLASHRDSITKWAYFTCAQWLACNNNCDKLLRESALVCAKGSGGLGIKILVLQS